MRHTASGHGFRRAVIVPKNTWALARAGLCNSGAEARIKGLLFGTTKVVP